MGVPTFFRWLTMRNPKMVLDCMEPEDNSGDSLNPMVDNFYVDMNGLIHPSCNPQPEHNIRLPANFQEQCENIFEYLDKLMSIVRPRKLLYLAIDGVAPRAKMNQQRSRRFRAARESLQNEERKKKLRDEYMRNGMWTQEIEDYVNRKSFDSNVITPGT